MIPVSAPPRVAAWLRETGDGPVPVVHRGPDAVYVDVRGRIVGVITTRATAVPCALSSTRAHLGTVTTAYVEAGVLHLDGEPVVVGRHVDVRVPRLAASDRPVGERAVAPDVAALVGAGDGLTPYGDDVLCGWLALHRAAGLPTPAVDADVARLAHRTTLLSATLLDCAVHGEVIPQFGAFVRALGTDAEPAAVAALAAVGHSSGRGLLEGARTALAGLGAVLA